MTDNAGSVKQKGVKQKGELKTARIPIKIVPVEETLKKPSWIRVKAPTSEGYKQTRDIMRDNRLSTVCEEAGCPNVGECWSQGHATMMIMGEICTRGCSFCNVITGKPDALDVFEPGRVAHAVQKLGLKHVVITSVDRDDLDDGGAEHFAECIREIRRLSPSTQIEVLVPDFRGRLELALDILSADRPDVMNHNLETAPRLYKQARPGSDYLHSLQLLQQYKQRNPDVVTKSGIMVGLGETDEEVYEVMADMRAHDIDMITIGQYLQPSKSHAPVDRFVHPDEFDRYTEYGKKLGFANIWAAPMVRSSYFADRQYYGEPCPRPTRGTNPLSEADMKKSGC